MHLRWNGETVTLLDPQDFRTFRIVIDGPAAQRPLAMAGFRGVAAFVDDRTAWVSQAALRAWPGLQHDAGWQRGLDAMIDKARPHGWIDEATGDIRSHVEWGAA